MREIIFRGKDHLTGEWVEGCLVYQSLECGLLNRILVFNGEEVITHRVIPETIGQYTGLTDKDGAKIFEGDKIKPHYGIHTIFDELVVIWHDHGWSMKNTDSSRQSGYIESMYMDDIEVIGTIHDQAKP